MDSENDFVVDENGQNEYLSSREIITFNQEKTKLNNTTKLRKSSSSSDNSISDEEILTKEFNQILNFNDNIDTKIKINISNYFENIDYDHINDINYKVYESELQMNEIMTLIQKDLSEPYSIYTYRYFIHNWPQLCFLAFHQDKIVGAIVCKHGLYKSNIKRGYIAMLAVNENYRRKSIGSNLVKKAIIAMQKMGADEIVLETEVTNKYALKLYENLGFVRAKRLFKYYLNQGDALRLKFFING